MKKFTVIGLSVGLAMLAEAQGPLSPPGPPDATMRSLDELETRIPIDSVPITIDQPGSYYLTGNLDADSDSGIQITASGVSIDMMGFTLSGSGTYGIEVLGPNGSYLSHAIIRNGQINGFGSALRLNRCVGALVERMHLRGAGNYGLIISATGASGSVSEGNIIRDCMIVDNLTRGLAVRAGSGGSVANGNRIERSVIANNLGTGIEISAANNAEVRNNVIYNCTVTGNGFGVSSWYAIDLFGSGLIEGNRIESSTITDNASRGIYLRPSGGGSALNNTFRRNTIHNHSNAGMLIGLSISESTIRNTLVEGNVISWNALNGGLRFSDGADLWVEDMHVRDNVFADNAAASTSPQVQISGSRGTVSGNHVSGDTNSGLEMNSTQAVLVSGNSVFGGAFTTSSSDTYGPVVTALPVPNNFMANFRLDD